MDKQTIDDLAKNCRQVDGTFIDLTNESDNDTIVCQTENGRISMHDRKQGNTAEVFNPNNMGIKAELQDVQDINSSPVSNRLEIENQKGKLSLEGE